MSYSYGIRIGVAAWRRKSTIIIAVGLLVILGFGLEYNKFDIFSNSSKNLQNLIYSDSVNRNEKSNKSNSVHFLEQAQAPAGYNENAARFENHEMRSDNLEEDMGIPYINVDPVKPYIPNQRLVHFDLKGAPPKVSYLKRVFPLLKLMGATGLLIEYEDMFPFKSPLEEIKASNAYSENDISEIISAAENSGLEVIPLVQTFGHMEFALKHEKFVSLRENPESPQALCPSRNASLIFVKELIAQVMRLHPKINYIHVGCDEVFQMGECEKCRQVVRETLFLQHVKTVVQIVKEKWPHLKIIIWDDMLRHISQQTLEDMAIGQLVEPMVWVYVEQIYRFVQTQVWEKYGAVFPTIWAASAFKGAYGETMFIPNAKRHLTNNLRWVELMAEQSKIFQRGFAGIVITGWQRYDHFAVLCELFPAAFPTLALSLVAVSHGYFNESMRNEVYSALSCPTYQVWTSNGPFVTLNSDPYLWDKFSRCMFPGNGFFKLTNRLYSVQAEVNDFVKSVQKEKGWMTDYNARHNYSAPLRVEELMGEFPRVYHSITSLARSANEAMSEVYDIFTVSEWVEQRIYPYIKILETIQNQSITLKLHKTWPKRPLPPLKDLQRFGVPLPTDD